MKNKKACLISKFIYENDTRLQQQVSILQENGFDVDVICYLEQKKQTTLDNGATVYGVATPGDKDTILKYIFNTIRFSIPAFFKLQALSFRGKYDVIIVHTLPELMVFNAFVQKILGSKIILDIRDTSVELFASKWDSGNKRLARHLIVFLANISCKFADKILVASPGFKDKLLERNVPENKITVIFNSADTSIFKFDKERSFNKISDGLKIIYHGSIADRFGIDVAINAVKKVSQSIPNTTLNIYGFYDEGYKSQLEQLISSLNLEDVVQLNGRLSLEEIYLKIKDSDLGIVPYKAEFFMQLAFSTKLFEYVTSGIPVVTSRLRPAELVFSEDCIFFVNPNDSDELADKILEVSENPQLRKDQVQKGYENYQKISSDVMKKRYIDVIRSLV